MKRSMFARLSLTALAIAVSILSVPAFAQPGYATNDSGNQAGDPPSRVARLSYITGKVSFEPSGEEQWNQASMNYPMTTGDRLYTDSDGRAELETGNIAVRLAPGTDLTTTSLSDNLIQLGLSQGTLRVRAFNMYAGNSIEIDTPSAALTLLRAGSYRVETYPDGNTTLVAVNEGDLEISGSGINQTLHAGQAIKLEGTDDVRMEWISAPERDDFDQWCSDRDRRFTNSGSRQYVSEYTPGYADLDEYGRWDVAPDYGRVWYPSQVAVDWAPYRYGRWAWIDPWGWTWVEDEPWGFAPFHYGRWALIGSRWGWVPGPVVTVRPIYAPALVAFVGGPNANVQVWFPLGPRDPYLPWYHHTDVYLRQVNVTNVRVVNVTNIRVENIHYTYQRIAPTACSTEVFRGSRPVGREMVRVDVNVIGRARVIPHPEIHPDERAIHAGLPTVHPPVERTRPRIETRVVNTRPAVQTIRTEEPRVNPGNPAGRTHDQDRDARQSDDRRREERQRSDGRDGDYRHDVAATPAEPGRLGHDAAPAGEVQQRETADAHRPQPVTASNNDNRGPAGGPPQERRPLITRNPAPPQNPPFSQRQQAMQDHPGRPLEPQQMNNIRRGEPAGPRQDREVPSHTERPAQKQNPQPARNDGKPERERR